MGLTKTFTLKLNTDDAEKELKDLGKEVEKVDKKVKDTSESTSEMTSQLDKLTGGAVSGFKKMAGSLKLVTTGFKGMKSAIISTGIGALIIGVVALTAAFKGSEEGQNKFAKIMSVIGALTGNLADLLADLGEAIINAFTNPVETLKNFAGSIQTYVMDKINGVIDGIGLFGTAIKKVFSGDFKGALDDATDGFSKIAAASPLGVLNDGIQALTKSTKEFAKEQIKEANAAAKVADMRAKADKIERNLIVERSKLESEIALLRLKSREEDKFTAEERKQALLDAQALEDTLLDKETEYLELRRDAQIQENTFSRSNKENLTKEAEAIAAVNRQIATRANTARQVQREVVRISRQIQAQNKADAAAKKAEDDKIIADEKVRTDAIGKIQEEFKQKQKDLDAETELQKIALEEERKLAELDRLDATEAQKAEVIAFYQNKIQDVKDKNAAEDEKNEKIKNAAQLSMVKNTLGNMSTLFDDQSAAGKATAAAAALINTYQGITAELATKTVTPFEFGVKIANIATTAAIGFKSVKDILKTTPSNAKGGTNPASGAGGGGAPIPPAFNIVGSSGETQLADAIGGQSQRPARAYVVSNDVTTAQEMDRNIIEGASI